MNSKELKDQFTDKGYCIVKNAIGGQACTLVANYLSFIDAYHKNLLVWEESQNSAGRYNDPLGESLLFQIQPVVEECTGLKLIPTYSYLRAYKTQAQLKKHTDRPACEISATLFLGADNQSPAWPIFIEVNDQPIAIELEPGDMMVYKGCETPHWREQFQGQLSIHAFLHFIDANGKHTDQAFDGRKGLGAPQLRDKPADLKNSELQKQLWDKAREAEQGNNK